ncbi:MAG: alpha/beta hydrolase [Ruminococcus sp.]|nr:alpha/beta hydrolase [Ruminococcus sp.]
MTFSEELENFERTHKYRKISGGDNTFRCILSGGEDKPALVFFNGLGMQEMWIRYAAAFESEYRSVILEYPLETKTADELISGVNALLTGLNIKNPVIIGGSDGGALAQVYAKKYPRSISGLVLITTLGIDSDYLKDVKKIAFLTPLLAFKIKHSDWNKMKSKLVDTVYSYFADETDEEKEYGKSFIQVIAADDNYKNKYIHSLKILADISRHGEITAGDFPRLKEKILLLMPEKDIFSKSDQEKLIAAMGEGAKTVWLKGGHLSCVMRAEEYINEIRDFLPRCFKE